MEYERFVVRNYRAILGPLELDVRRNRLMPIIGINEAGKTTILHAVFAFDSYNDKLNDRGRHLRDTSNLYKTSSPPPQVTAILHVPLPEMIEALEALADDGDANHASIVAKLLRKRRQFPDRITIHRNLTTRAYNIETPPFNIGGIFGDRLAHKIIGQAPYILFFDDFRDSVDERIEIVDVAKSTGWLAIIEQLFKRTDPSFSAFRLPGMEERQRKSVLAKVKKHLNTTLTREWQNFRLDDSDALEISLEYEAETTAIKPESDNPVTPEKGTTQTRHYLKLDVIEKDAAGDEHYFFVRDRSKGFYWFFNFVMKLEFNPKLLSDNDATVYLLDEPGSYLHASAQSKLCAKLRYLSQRNCVVYCTHSHYLLDPELIPLGTIQVADKNANGSIERVPIHHHQGSIVERRSAFQPVVDALQIKPFLLDLTSHRVVLTEGIYDYYSLLLFKGGRNVTALPSVGASSVKFYVSLMIAWRVPFVALWDNDDEGRRARIEATALFGEELAASHFFCCPPATINGGSCKISSTDRISACSVSASAYQDRLPLKKLSRLCFSTQRKPKS